MKNPFVIPYISLSLEETYQLLRVYDRVNKIAKKTVKEFGCGSFFGTNQFRKDIDKQCNEILKKYNTKFRNFVDEMMDYDKDGFIEFLNINLSHNVNLGALRTAYKEYNRLVKKFKNYE